MRGRIPLVGKRRPLTLRREMFAAGVQVLGQRSPVASYLVPRRSIVGLLVGKPFELMLRGKHTETQTSAAATVTLDLSTSLTLVKSAHADDYPLPATEHPDVTVYDGAGNLVTIEAINYDNGLVDVTNPDTVNPVTYTAYGLLGNGAISLVAVAPAGVDSQEIELFNQTLRALHETDQASARTAPRINRPGLNVLPLGPKWHLDIVVKSGAEIAWTDAARQVVQFEAETDEYSGNQALLNNAIRETLQ